MARSPPLPAPAPPGFGGDGGPAAQAVLYFPDSLTIDSAGNLLFADQNQVRVRKITPAGVISTVAGNGNLAYSVDGSGALSSGFAYITGIAVDSTGNIYISEEVANRIKKITPAGGLSTYAGSSGSNYGSPSGFGFGGDGQSAGQAVFAYPGPLAVDPTGNLYISDTLNYRIRRVDATVGTITTIAGNGKCCYAGDGAKATAAQVEPLGMIADANGGLWITDPSASATSLATAASTGSPAEATMASPATISQPMPIPCTTSPPASRSTRPAKCCSPIRTTAASASSNPTTPRAWTS